MIDPVTVMTNEYALRARSGHRISRGRILQRFRLALMKVGEKRRKGYHSDADRLAKLARGEVHTLLMVSWRPSRVLKHAHVVERILDRQETLHG